MSEFQVNALLTACASVLVAASAFLPQYSAAFTAVALFMPKLGPVLVGLFRRG